MTEAKAIKVYVAGKVSTESHFGTHDWRDAFVAELEVLSGLKLINVDPTKLDIAQNDISGIFGGDAYMINSCDVVVAYLSDDISIGGSQEILVAKYCNKPVIGLAPLGGKFNGSTKEYFGKIVENYKDPFVFSTCDVVCVDEKEVAAALQQLDTITPKDISLIEDSINTFKRNLLDQNEYLKNLGHTD